MINDERKKFLQTEILKMLEETDWAGPTQLNDLEKMYADLLALEEEVE